MSLEDQWRMCTRKRRYGTPKLAEAAIVSLWLAGKGDGLKVYRCQVPEQETHWHVGHLVPWWIRRAGELDD